MFIPQTYLFVAGLCFNFLNGFSRFIWGLFIDKFGFKKIMYLITGIEIIVGISFYFVDKIEILFIIELLLIAICIGGTFAILTPIFINVFGLFVGPELYGLTGISIGCSNVLGPFLLELFSEENSSFLIIFLIGTGLCIIKLIVLIFFDENKKMYNDIDDIKKNIDMQMINNDLTNDDENTE
jgi:MFS family permease